MQKYLSIFLISTSLVAFTDDPPPLLWQNIFGDPNSQESCRAVEQLDDGGYILGCRYYNSNEFGLSIVLIGPTGEIIWQKFYGESRYYNCTSVLKVSETRFAFSGRTQPFFNDGDIYLFLSDANGDSLWSRTFGGSEDEDCVAVMPSSDGGYILAGTTKSYGAGGADLFLVGVDSLGNQAWTSTFGDSLDNTCTASSQCQDGGFILSAVQGDPYTSSDTVTLVRTDCNGTEIWTNSVVFGPAVCCCSVIEAEDGGFILCGHTWNALFLGKTDDTGNPTWFNTYEWYNPDYCIWGNRAIETDDGDIIAAGVRWIGESRVTDYLCLMRTDAQGNQEWVYSPDMNDATFYDLRQTTDGGLVAVGYADTASAGPPEWNVIIQRFSSEQTIQADDPGGYATILLPPYPNPFSAHTTVVIENEDVQEARLDIFDISGRLLETLVNTSIEPGEYSLVFDGTGLADGIYLIRLTTQTAICTERCMLIR